MWMSLQMEQRTSGTNETQNPLILELLAIAQNESRVQVKLMEHVEYRLHKSFLLYVPPAIYLVGIVGNLLSFTVLARKRMRRVSTYTYLAVLSVADTFVLTIGLLMLWFGQLTGKDVRARYAWSCKLLNVFSYTASDFSVWLIIAVTVERFIAVCYPLQAASMCTHRTAMRVVIGIFALVLGFNLNFIWTTNLQLIAIDVDYNAIYQCSAADGFDVFVNKVWPWIDAVLYSSLPFGIILLLNALIIRRVIQARRSRNHGLASGRRSTDRVGLRRRAGGNSVAVGGSKTAGGETNTTLSLMLLTITCAFLVMTLPMNVMLIAAAFWKDLSGDTFHRRAKFHLAKTVSELLMYVNHSINFFLYCGTGQKFRQELCALLCRWNGKTKNKSDPRSISFNMTPKHSVIVYH